MLVHRIIEQALRIDMPVQVVSCEGGLNELLADLAIPSVIVKEVARQYEVEAFGHTEDVSESYYAISVECRVRPQSRSPSTMRRGLSSSLRSDLEEYLEAHRNCVTGTDTLQVRVDVVEHDPGVVVDIPVDACGDVLKSATGKRGVVCGISKVKR
jgi:hypothetical protein